MAHILIKSNTKYCTHVVCRSGSMHVLSQRQVEDLLLPHLLLTRRPSPSTSTSATGTTNTTTTATPSSPATDLVESTKKNPPPHRSSQPPMDSYLDIGAGDGNVTAKIAPFFKNVTATEVSPAMACWVLRLCVWLIRVDVVAER